jgi:hypothetical protein
LLPPSPPIPAAASVERALPSPSSVAKDESAAARRRGRALESSSVVSKFLIAVFF